MLFSATVWPRSWWKQLQHKGDDGCDVGRFLGIREVPDRKGLFGIVWGRIGKSYEHNYLRIYDIFQTYHFFKWCFEELAWLLAGFVVYSCPQVSIFHMLICPLHIKARSETTCLVLKWGATIDEETHTLGVWLMFAMDLGVFIGIFTVFLCLSGWWKMIQIPSEKQQTRLANGFNGSLCACQWHRAMTTASRMELRIYL